MLVSAKENGSAREPIKGVCGYSFNFDATRVTVDDAVSIVNDVAAKAKNHQCTVNYVLLLPHAVKFVNFDGKVLKKKRTTKRVVPCITAGNFSYSKYDIDAYLYYEDEMQEYELKADGNDAATNAVDKDIDYGPLNYAPLLEKMSYFWEGLTTLIIGGCAEVKTLDTELKNLKRLKLLEISFFPELRAVTVSDFSAELECLKVFSAQKLVTINGIEECTKLRVVSLEYTDALVLESNLAAAHDAGNKEPLEKNTLDTASAIEHLRLHFCQKVRVNFFFMKRLKSVGLRGHFGDTDSCERNGGDAHQRNINLDHLAYSFSTLHTVHIWESDNVKDTEFLLKLPNVCHATFFKTIMLEKTVSPNLQAAQNELKAVAAYVEREEAGADSGDESVTEAASLGAVKYQLASLSLAECSKLLTLEGLIAFQNLQNLELLYNENLPEMLDCGDLAFLERLHISSCNGLVELNSLWKCSRLKSLSIMNCEKLKRIDDVLSSSSFAWGLSLIPTAGGAAAAQRTSDSAERHDATEAKSCRMESFCLSALPCLTTVGNVVATYVSVSRCNGLETVGGMCRTTYFSNLRRFGTFVSDDLWGYPYFSQK